MTPFRRASGRPWAVIAALACVASIACSSPTEEEPERRIRFAVRSVRLEQLESRELIVELVRPGGAIRVTDATFTTSDSSIATISRQGVVRSVGPRGNATIGASWNGMADSIPVQVIPVGDGISITPADLRVRQDSSLTISGNLVDRVGAPIAGVPVTFEVLTPWLISLSGTTVSVIEWGLEARIAASADRFVDTLAITIVQVADRIQTSTRAVALREGEQGWVGVYLYDLFDGMILTEPTYSVSSDPSIVTAQGNDLLAVGAGRTAVTFSRGPLSATVPVTVTPDALDPSIRFRLETPGAPASIVDADLSGWTNARQVFVAVPGNDLILQMEWGNWGFLDTLYVPGAPSALAAHLAGGPLFAGLAADGALARIDPVSRMETGRVDVGGVPAGVELSSDGTRAFVLRDDGMLVVLDAAGMLITDSLPVPGAVHVRRDPSAARLFLAAPDSGCVWLVRHDTLRLDARWPVDNRPRATAATRTRNEVYVAGEDGSLAILELATGYPLASVPLGEPITDVALLDTGSWVSVFAVAPTGAAYRVSTVDRAVDCTVNLGGAPGGAIGSVLGDMMLVGNAAGWVDFLVCTP
jgi:hypothetical protein